MSRYRLEFSGCNDRYIVINLHIVTSCVSIRKVEHFVKLRVFRFLIDAFIAHFTALKTIGEELRNDHNFSLCPNGFQLVSTKHSQCIQPKNFTSECKDFRI